jgi:ATP-dependent DNA ligase
MVNCTFQGKLLDQLALLVRDRDNYELAEKNAVEFRVSAVGSATNPNMTGREMVALMEQNISNPGMISYIPQKLIRNTPLSVLDEANAVMNAGMNEGIILRNPDSVYSGVRSDNLLKVKGITSGIFTVVGFTQSATTGFTSYMSVEGVVNGINKTSRVYGLNEEEEQELWMNQTSYLGKQVLIVYMGFDINRQPAKSCFRSICLRSRIMLPQLANTYNPTKNYGVAEWLSSPKLDGVRCLYQNSDYWVEKSIRLGSIFRVGRN